jgi:proton-coupled amino acid transporter
LHIYSTAGNTLTASGHIITAVIGGGVLTLPYSMASLGWIGGPICFVLFASITLYTAQLLADLYIIDGKRMRTYTMMVETVMGRPGKIAIGVVQQFNLVLTALAYTVTAGQAMQNLAKSACGSEKVADGECFDSFWKMAVIFGALQIIMSFGESLERYWWASMIGAAMSFGYSIIGLVLACVYFDTKGTIQGIQLETSSATAWNMLNAIGAILFAYSFSFILLEIQDTLHSPKGMKHGPIIPMKRAVNICVSIMTSFYIAIAVFGYLSQGNEVQPYILDSFPDAPAWVTDAANAMVLVHMIPAYQVWSQPHFEWLQIQFPIFEHNRVYKYGYRILYVCVVTFFAILLPFFGIILGFVGAVGFWPATIFFPIECWCKVFRPGRKQRIAMQCLDVFCFCVTVACIVASVQSIVANASSMQIFGD